MYGGFHQYYGQSFLRAQCIHLCCTTRGPCRLIAALTLYRPHTHWYECSVWIPVPYLQWSSPKLTRNRRGPQVDSYKRGTHIGPFKFYPLLYSCFCLILFPFPAPNSTYKLMITFLITANSPDTWFISTMYFMFLVVITTLIVMDYAAKRRRYNLTSNYCGPRIYPIFGTMEIFKSREVQGACGIPITERNQYLHFFLLFMFPPKLHFCHWFSDFLRTIGELSVKYGPMYHIWMGKELVVVIEDPAILRTLLSSPKYITMYSFYGKLKL